MGIIQDLKNIMLGKAKRENLAMAQMMNGTIPIFSVGGNDYYINDIVQQCVSCYVNEMVKLNPMHVRSGVPFWGAGSINSVLEVPNEFMTKADFLEKVTWNLMVDYNSFVLPAYTAYLDANGVEKRRYTAMYPVRPQNVVYMTDATGTLYVKMKFNRFAGDGLQEITVPYSDVIHIRYAYGQNEMFGGDAGGRPDRRALLRTLDLNNRLLDGVAKGVEASYRINGIVSYRGVINAEATRQAVIEFENKLRDPNNRAGTLVMDDSSTYTPISINAKLVDKDTLEFIESKILRTMGVSAAILSGDYTKPQYEAFYQAEIEPLVLKFGQAFTRCFFTQRELSYGNKIIFYPRDLVFMSTSEILEAIRLLGDSGTIYENEKRHFLGLSPLPELENVRMQSLNYVNSNIADHVQINNSTSKATTNS